MSTDPRLEPFRSKLDRTEFDDLVRAVAAIESEAKGPAIERFDGATVWDKLNPPAQADIGCLAIEWAYALMACEIISEEQVSGPVPRAMSAAVENAESELVSLVGSYIDELAIDRSADRIPVPLSVGPVCRRCGCTEKDGCVSGCSWRAPDLCSEC